MFASCQAAAYMVSVPSSLAETLFWSCYSWQIIFGAAQLYKFMKKCPFNWLCFQVTRGFGVPGLKQAMDWFGYFGGRTREPLQPLTAAQTDSLKKAFTDNGFTSELMK